MNTFQTNISRMLQLTGFCATLAFVCSAQAQAQQPSFASPEAAADALVVALGQPDTAVLQSLLGEGSEDIVSSGDDVADKNVCEDFIELYQKKHIWVPAEDGSMALQVGDNEWPLPIPLIKKDGSWVFDGAAGVEEVIDRRIGRNELGAIASSRGFLEAQREYAAEGRDGLPAGIYANKLVSTPGQHDGLYWPVADGEPESPAGEGVARAAAEGYRAAAPGAARVPYHGYYFRMLFAQGEHAQGGAQDYFDQGLLTQGVALLAWPADYGVSGVTSFMVNHDGVVYQKDLGEETATVVQSIKVFNPDASWEPVTD